MTANSVLGTSARKGVVDLHDSTSINGGDRWTVASAKYLGSTSVLQSTVVTRPRYRAHRTFDPSKPG